MQSQMSEVGIPGVSLATIDQGAIAVTSFGVKALGSSLPVGEATVFTAASLSKPLVSYITLQLVDDGFFDLDELLSEYVQEGIPSEVTSSPITARHILTHTSGLPNTRSDAALKSHFSPGSRFSYSSLGFSYLQRALQAVTNQPLEALAERFVFHPLGMSRSSFVWQDRFDDDFAVPHQCHWRGATLTFRLLIRSRLQFSR